MSTAVRCFVSCLAWSFYPALLAKDSSLSIAWLEEFSYRYRMNFLYCVVSTAMEYSGDKKIVYSFRLTLVAFRYMVFVWVSLQVTGQQF